jgi:hypothetical protein
VANRSRGAFDITLDSGDLKMGFTLFREINRDGTSKPAVVTSEIGPGRIDEHVRSADVPRVIDDLSAGMGFSRRVESVPNGYAYAYPGYTRAPGGIFCPAGKVTEIAIPAAGSWQRAPIVESVRFRGDTYLIAQGRHILKLPGGNGPAVIAFDGGSASFVGSGQAIFNDKLYVGGGYAGLASLDAAGTWTGPAAVPRSKLRSVSWRPQGIPTQVLVGVDYPSSVSWCPITADPMLPASWSAPLRVGDDSAYPINEIAAAPRHVYFLRPDGVWDMDELGARAFNITPWMAEDTDANNGQFGLHTGEGLYYGHVGGLCYIPTSGEAQYHPQWVHPGWGLPYEGLARGFAIAGTLHQGWGLVALYDGATSSIMAGKASEDAYGEATHVWHGAEAVIPERVTHMKVHNPDPDVLGQPELLIATASWDVPPIIKLYKQSLPKTGTPILEMAIGTAFEPADASSLFLPADPWDRPSARKALLQVDMVTERLSLTDYLTVHAAADAGGYAEQGRADDGAFTSLVPLELTEGRFLKTRVDLAGHGILRSLELRAAVSFDLREARLYKLVLGADNGLKTPRGRENRDPVARMLDLQTMLGRVVVLEDEYPMRVRVLQIMAPERRALGAPNRAGAWALVVPVLVSILDHPFRWDGADYFDTDRTWR